MASSSVNYMSIKSIFKINNSIAFVFFSIVLEIKMSTESEIKNNV